MARRAALCGEPWCVLYYVCAIAVTTASLYGRIHSAPQSETAACVCVPGTSADLLWQQFASACVATLYLSPAGYVEDVNPGGACVDVGRTDLTWIKVLDPATGRVTHINW
jgi:hypothetical protein